MQGVTISGAHYAPLFFIGLFNQRERKMSDVYWSDTSEVIPACDVYGEIFNGEPRHLDTFSHDDMRRNKKKRKATSKRRGRGKKNLPQRRITSAF